MYRTTSHFMLVSMVCRDMAILLGLVLSCPRVQQVSNKSQMLPDDGLEEEFKCIC